jgi:hypothetical protein
MTKNKTNLDVTAVRVPHRISQANYSKDRQPQRNPGRPPGSLNKITREMRDAILAAAEELGRVPFSKWAAEIEVENQLDGMKGFYKALAVNELRTFGIILARMMPTNVTHTTVAELPTYMTEDEVIEGLREAGLPLDLLDKMRVTDALTLSPEDYGENPYDDPEADEVVDVTPKKDTTE